MGAGLAVASLVSRVVATGVSMKEQSDARGEQRKQKGRVEAQNAAKAAVERRQALRAERVRRAQLTAQAEAGGFGDSSTAILGEQRVGGMAAEQTAQVSGALAATNALSGGNQAIADAQGRAQLFSNISSLSSSVFSASGGFGAAASLFDSGTKAKPQGNQ
jgi:hypothetical protein